MAKRAVFSEAQNAALRVALVALEARYTSQVDLGKAIGVEQQNAGRLLRDERAGFGYATASRVAHLSGFTGVDSFFVAKGVAHARAKDERPRSARRDCAEANRAR